VVDFTIEVKYSILINTSLYPELNLLLPTKYHFKKINSFRKF